MNGARSEPVFTECLYAKQLSNKYIKKTYLILRVNNCILGCEYANQSHFVSAELIKWDFYS